MEAVVKALLVVVVVVGTGQAAADINLVNGAYTGVVVALRDDLDPSKCLDYIQRSQSMISNASTILYNVTNSKLYFGEVTIVVPAPASTWPCLGVNIETNTRRLGWADAHLRLGPQHPLFMDNPWTQQPRGCGEPGDFTYIPENFLFSNSNLVSRDKFLIHEWAKLRWGVFEEYGHMHDPIYPSAYHANANSFRPNYCTNEEVSGSFSDECTQHGKEEDCSFIPDTSPGSNVGVTSSLLSLPFLNTVVKFCDSTDHDNTVPTKHNFLCDKLSTQEVINQHEDMKQPQRNTMFDTNFLVVRASEPGDTIVFVLDYSSPMTNVSSRWEFLKDSVIQFILVKALPQTTVGLVIFAGDVLNHQALLLLDIDVNRSLLVDVIQTTKIGNNKKDLLKAIIGAGQMLGNETGMIVLVTENLELYQPNQELVDAAQGHQVWPILYPHDPLISIQAYQDLADIVPGTPVLTINNTLDVYTDSASVYQSVENYAALTDNLLQVGGNSLEKVAEYTCLSKGCTNILAVDDSSQYEPDAYIEVLYSFGIKDIIVFNITNQKNMAIPVKSDQSTSKIYEIQDLQNTIYTVNMIRESNISSVKTSLLATPNEIMNVLVWSSKGLNILQYSKASVPTLYAMVMKDWHHVLYADVTVTITTKDGPKILSLKDNGAGGDTTGNDGVYSAYMVDFMPPENVGIMVTATDNNGTARILSSVLHSAPFSGEQQACCGSQLIIPDELLEDPGNFTVSSALLAGNLTGDPHDPLPPAQIRDLRSSRDGTSITLSFTAPGDQLDQGTAAYYNIMQRAYGDSSHVYNETIEALEAGSLVQHSVTKQECGLLVFTVTAYSFNGNESKVSNEVREFISCTSSKPLTAGAITGIVIGSLLGVIIIIIIVFLCLNRDKRDDLCLWQVLTCKCIKRKKDDPSLYSSHPPNSARRSDIIRGNSTSVSGPIRNISDLYSKPNLDSKKVARQREQNGGFGEHLRQNENLQMRAVSDSSSQGSSSNPFSSQKSMPINQVGVPPAVDSPFRGYSPQYGYNKNSNQMPKFPNSSSVLYNGSQDNPAYDGHNDTDNYGDKHKPPRNPRINTQV